MSMSAPSATSFTYSNGASGFIPNLSHICGGIRRIPSAPASFASFAISIDSAVFSQLTPEMIVITSPHSSAQISTTRFLSALVSPVISPVCPLHTSPSIPFPQNVLIHLKYALNSGSLIEQSSLSGTDTAGKIVLNVFTFAIFIVSFFLYEIT